MAFLARMSSQGKLIDCEVITGNHSKCLSSPKHIQSIGLDVETDTETLRTVNSRTYIKSYDYDSDKCNTPPTPTECARTVRYVAGSISSSELMSVAETETSTLRCASPISMSTLRSAPEMETETETLRCTPCLSHASGSSGSIGSTSTSSSGSSSSSAEEAAEEEVLTEPLALGSLDDKDSTTSMCSWEAMYEEPKPAEDYCQLDIVPPLPLSGDSSSRIAEQDHMHDLKLERQAAEAYENWLSAKQQQRQYRVMAERAQRERLEQEAALRQQLAEERFQQWCLQKERLAAVAEPKARMCQSRPKGRRPGNEAKLRRMHAWEQQKVKEAERQRKLLQSQAEQKRQEQQQRKLRADQAWQQWMQNVAHRPKPVPLNQGLNSLRGTISDIYINPNEWVSTFE